MRTAFLLLLLFVCSSPLQADEGHVETDRQAARHLPLPPSQASFHFLIFGDRTGGPPEGLEVLRHAVRDANLLAPDFVMTVGDMVPGYNGRGAWLAQMRDYRDIMAKLHMPWYPVAGNHDVYWRGGTTPPGHHEKDYEEHFGPLWYWFGHKHAAFIVLYSDEGDAETNEKGWGEPRVNRFSDAQLAWLRRTLEATASFRQVFLFLHHPRWITTYYPGSNWEAVHDLLVKAGNVRAVFGGHIHRRRYDGRRDGIEYFALATTGGRVPFESPGTGFLHHMDLVTVREDGIAIATIPVDAVLDPRAMTPAHLEEIDRLRQWEALPSDSVIAFDTRGAGAGTYAIELENPTSRPVEMTLHAATEDTAWSFAPDHVHAVLEPGQRKEIVFDYRREPRDGLRQFAFVDLVLQVDYLAEDMRVRIPERRLGLDWRLIDVPPSVFHADEEAALRLDGTSACLMVENVRLDLPDGPFTVEAWVRSADYAGRRALLGKTERSEYGLFVSDGAPSFSVYLDTGYATVSSPAPILEPNRWHHVAGVYDGSALFLYVDGTLIRTREAEGRRKKNAWPLYIGADPDAGGQPSGLFEGWVDEVRVSKTSRYDVSTFEPSRRFEPDADTLLLLHLDGPVGPFAPDHGPRGRHARALGRVGYEAP